MRVGYVRPKAYPTSPHPEPAVVSTGLETEFWGEGWYITEILGAVQRGPDLKVKNLVVLQSLLPNECPRDLSGTLGILSLDTRRLVQGRSGV